MSNTAAPRHWRCGTCEQQQQPSNNNNTKDIRGPDISGEWDLKTRHEFESWTEANFKKGGKQTELDLSPVEWDKNRENVVQSLKILGASHIVLFLQQRRIRFYL